MTLYLPTPGRHGYSRVDSCRLFLLNFASTKTLNNNENRETCEATSVLVRRDKMELAVYRRDILNFDRLPQVIAEAGALLMEVRGFGDTVVGRILARAILRITGCG